MNIHQIINDYDLSKGGAQRLVQGLHNHCIENGMNSKLLGLSRIKGKRLYSAISFDFKSPYQIGVFIKLYRYITNQITEGDLVHVNLFPASFYIAILKYLGLFNGVKLIFTEHNTSNNRRNKFWGKFLDSFTYSAYDNIVAISQSTADALIGWMPQIKTKVVIIQNGIELYYKKVIHRKKEKNPIVILTVGRIHKQKNYATMLEALSKVNLQNYEYWIAGTGNLKEELTKNVKSLKLTDKVRFLNYVEDIPELLKKADIFLMMSLWEGFGLAAVEAMNASLPCVISDVPGLGNLIERDGYEGYLLSPKNPELIAEKLKELIKNPDKRTEMGKNAFTRSLVYDQNLMFENYLSLYNKLEHN